MDVRDFSTEDVAQLARQINTAGFACIHNYLSPADLALAQQFVSGTIAQEEKKYVHFNGPEAVNGSGLDDLAHASSFVNLMHELYRSGTGKAPQEQDFYQVLRCLAGSSGHSNSLIFHYDSYVVTALIPIFIPQEGQRGDLLMYPNTRAIRPAYLLNAIDKVLLDNRLTQRVLRKCVNSAHLGPTRIPMVPGDLYLFWGYRSIHTNAPCDPDKIRATAVFHYMNPHLKAPAAAQSFAASRHTPAQAPNVSSSLS